MVQAGTGIFAKGRMVFQRGFASSLRSFPVLISAFPCRMALRHIQLQNRRIQRVFPSGTVCIHRSDRFHRPASYPEKANRFYGMGARKLYALHCTHRTPAAAANALSKAYASAAIYPLCGSCIVVLCCYPMAQSTNHTEKRQTIRLQLTQKARCSTQRAFLMQYKKHRRPFGLTVLSFI